MRSPFSGLFPNILGSVEVRRILGKEMDLNEAFDVLQPLSDLFRLVPGCVVHNQVDLPSFVVTEQLLDELRKGAGVVSLYESEVPTRLFVNPNRSHHFCSLATRKTLHLGTLSPSCPGSMQCACLTEGRLILVDQYPALLLDFFLVPQVLEQATGPAPGDLHETKPFSASEH